MYYWKVEFHMKNGDVIETKIESKYNTVTDLCLKEDSGLLLNGRPDGNFSAYTSDDGKKEILIKVGEISSVHVDKYPE